MMLRSLKQARYTDQSLGHFGLAAQYYTHFTSPIRRYPDTMVHRLIHFYEENGINAKSKERYADLLEEIGTHSSEMERRAVDAERDTDSMKKADYMADHLGEEFDATVSSVMKFGMFIELPNTVEGLIHISRLTDDYYEYVEKYLALVGRKTHRTYRIGQPVKVKVVNVDKEQSQIDFALVDPKAAPVSDLLPKREHHSYSGNRNRNGRPNDHRHSQNNGNRNNNKNGNRNGGRNNNVHRTRNQTQSGHRSNHKPSH